MHTLLTSPGTDHGHSLHGADTVSYTHLDVYKRQQYTTRHVLVLHQSFIACLHNFIFIRFNSHYTMCRGVTYKVLFILVNLQYYI